MFTCILNRIIYYEHVLGYGSGSFLSCCHCGCVLGDAGRIRPCCGCDKSLAATGDGCAGGMISAYLLSGASPAATVMAFRTWPTTDAPDHYMQEFGHGY